VKPFNPGSPTLRACRDAWLSRRGAEERMLWRVNECRPHKGLFLLGFEGIDSLDALEPWIGALVEVDRGELAAPNEGEVYHHEALGLTVRTRAGVVVGIVVEVMALPTNDLWVVRQDPPAAGGAAREHLVPAVAPILTEINLRERVATIDPIPGLLED
jgi:16S rRNA processing protein RimM